MSDDPQYEIYVSGDVHTIRALRNGRKALQRSGIVMIVIGALAIIFPDGQHLHGAVHHRPGLSAGRAADARRLLRHSRHRTVFRRSALEPADGRRRRVPDVQSGRRRGGADLADRWPFHGARSVRTVSCLVDPAAAGLGLDARLRDHRHCRRPAYRRRPSRHLAGADRPAGRHQFPRRRRPPSCSWRAIWKGTFTSQSIAEARLAYDLEWPAASWSVGRPFSATRCMPISALASQSVRWGCWPAGRC